MSTDELGLAIDVTDRVMLIELNRPTKMNALSGTMIEELTSLMGDIPAGVRAIVLTGRGKAFCAGADIGVYAAGSHEDQVASIASGRRLCEVIETCVVPVIAAVNGMALGGGFEVVLASDLVIAVPTAQLALPEVQLGLIPGWGGTQRLTAHVGPHKAKEMVLTSSRIDAGDAHRLGIVNSVVDPANLMETALSMAGSLAARSSPAMRAAKRAINAHRDVRAEQIEHLELAKLFTGDDANEGIAAFVEKRAAQFR